MIRRLGYCATVLGVLAMVFWTFRPYESHVVSRAQGQTGPGALFVDGAHQESFSMERPSFLPAPARVPPPAQPPGAQVTPGGTPDGQIAFVSDRDGDDEIYVMNTDGSAVTKLTDNPNKDWWPSWSPDGRRIVFNSDRAGDHEIYVMNADGSGLVQLTRNSANDWFAKWSPDGRQIIFASTRDGDHEIYVMRTDGSGLTSLTENSETDWLPSWSPDGRRIAFTATRQGNTDLYTMNIDGSGVTRLTHHSAGDYDPNWSPDGRRIAFQSDRDGDYELYLMNADGSGVTQLTHNSAYDGQLEWSPDGQRIIFHSNRDGDDEIYLMNPDGSGITKLTDNTAEDSAASWAPARIEASPSPQPGPTPTNTPVPPPIPNNTPVPTPTSMSPPTPTPAPTMPPSPTTTLGGPLVDFVAETTETKTGQPVDISLAVVNLKTNPDIDVHVVLRSPTGLQLSGDSCPSVAQCSDAYELSAGAQSAMSLRATAKEAGQFTMEAYVTWQAKDGEPSHLKKALVLNVVDPVEGETEVTLHATQTEIQVGQPVRLNLSAINSIVKPPMTLTLIIKTPSGWSLTGTGFADACGPQCIATYNLDSGQLRDIGVDMVPNQPGDFEVEARMEWYFGDDPSTLKKRTETLRLNVLGDPTPTPATEASGSNGNEQSTPTAGRATDAGENWVERNWVFLILALAGIVILALLGWIFGRPLDRMRSR